MGLTAPDLHHLSVATGWLELGIIRKPIKSWKRSSPIYVITTTFVDFDIYNAAVAVCGVGNDIPKAKNWMSLELFHRREGNF